MVFKEPWRKEIQCTFSDWKRSSRQSIEKCSCNKRSFGTKNPGCNGLNLVIVTRNFCTCLLSSEGKKWDWKLKGDDGSWITDVNLFKNMVVPFYQKLYTDEGNRGMPVNFVNYFSCLTDEQIASLMKPVTPRDVKDALFSMGAYKAPGDDGFQPLLPEILGCSWSLFVLYGVEGFP